MLAKGVESALSMKAKGTILFNALSGRSFQESLVPNLVQLKPADVSAEQAFLIVRAVLEKNPKMSTKKQEILYVSLLYR